MRRNGKCNSLLFRITLLLWLVIIFTALTISLAIIPYQKKTLVKNLETTAKVVATSVDQVAVSSIITEDFSPIVEQAMKIVNERRNILYIVITPRRGRSIIHVAGRWEYQALGGIWRPPASLVGKGRFIQSKLVNQEVFHYSYPLKYSGIDWGWINVGLSTKEYEENLHTIYSRTAYLALVAILLGLLLSHIFARQIGRPILSLNRVTKQIREGDLGSRAHSSAIKEVAELAESFNQMTASLEESHQKLIATKDYINNIIQSMNEALLVTSKDGLIRTINQRTSRLLKYKEEELIGQHINFVFPESQHCDEKGFENFIRETASTNRESYFTTKNGENIPVLLSISTLQNENQSIEGVIFVAQDIAARKKAEEELRKAHDELEMRVIERTEELSQANELLSKSLKEKQILLKEIHHRVKNNLQVISSLLYLQSRKIKDEASLSLFRDSQSRVKSMALIHEKLYQSQDLANINFADYVKSLTKYLLRTYRTGEKGVDLIVDAQDILLPLNSAIPCGLIINELVSNALKYAFPSNGKDKETGQQTENRIEVKVKQNGEGKYTLTVRDNGVGFPETVDFRKTQSLGLQLVNNLTSQLEGQVELHNHQGTEFVITF